LLLISLRCNRPVTIGQQTVSGKAVSDLGKQIVHLARRSYAPQTDEILSR
jgi:hypothetical protein